MKYKPYGKKHEQVLENTAGALGRCVLAWIKAVCEDVEMQLREHGNRKVTKKRINAAFRRATRTTGFEIPTFMTFQAAIFWMKKMWKHGNTAYDLFAM